MSLNFNQKNRDFTLLFFTRAVRMFSYGMIAIVMIKNLELKNFSGQEIGIIQSAVIFGDIVISLILTTKADVFGRKNTLMLGALLKLFTGLFYAMSNSLIILVITGIIGVISVTGTQIGPFGAVQQSTLTQVIQDCSINPLHNAKNTSKVFGYYNMVGYIAQACGGAFAGFLYQYLLRENSAWTKLEATNIFFYLYSILGFFMFIGYWLIDNSSGIQPKVPKQKPVLNCAGIAPKNFPTILMLSVLFATDAFGGAFIAKSFISYYFFQRFDIVFASIGMLLFLCNIISGISGIVSSMLVQRFGAMATMIFTHLPSNLFLLAIPFANNSYIAMILLLGRFCISQMDVPARQTYVSLMVSSAQRSAANGITNIARSVGLSVGMGLNGYFIKQNPEDFIFTFPFLLAGAIKIAYDIVLGCCFLWNQKKAKPEKHVQLQQVQNDKSASDYQIVDEIKNYQK